MTDKEEKAQLEQLVSKIEDRMHFDKLISNTAEHISSLHGEMKRIKSSICLVLIIIFSTNITITALLAKGIELI